MSQSQNWEDPSKIDADEKRYGKKLCTLVRTISRAYETHQADKDVRNLAYYRGEFWVGDGHARRKDHKYRAAQNEVFPILDTMGSALAMDLPQVELLKQTVASGVNRGNRDMSLSGRRVAACLNNMADEDDLDETVFEWVLHSLMFPKGIVKTTWSAKHGRVVWENKLPWEVFIDPTAKRMKDAAWAFEYVTLHWEDWKRRLKSGVYNLSEEAAPVRPDRFPRSLAERELDDIEQYEARLRSAGLKEFVGIVEFWDFRKGLVHHLHLGSNQILMTTKAPYERPYEVMVFHPGVGRVDGISDVSLMAPVQRDINELVNARKEMVHRLPRRMIFDGNLFNDEKAFSDFTKSKAWEPTKVDVPATKKLADSIFISPEMRTTYDFNQHLADNKEGIRRVAGEADYQRGTQKNIRTAAEFDGIRDAVEGRMQIRANKLTKGVTRLFRKGLNALKWGVKNQAYSNLDFEALVFATQDDVSPQVLAMDILHQTPRFRLLPFSPLMEDKNTRRRHLIEMIQGVFANLPPEEKLIDWRKVVEQLVSDFGLDPNIPKPLEQAQGELEAEQKVLAQEEAQQAPPIQSGAPLPNFPPTQL